MDIPLHTSYLLGDVSCYVILLGFPAAAISLTRIRYRHSWRGRLSSAIIALLWGIPVALLGYSAVVGASLHHKWESAFSQRYVTHTQAHKAIRTLYGATYLSGDEDSETYRAANGATLHDCRIQWIISRDTAHVRALSCRQDVPIAVRK